ncbi:MAG TPA: hypothetical protein PKM65_20660 [Spirochaetota bacterium]|nr:hypothetical protein [Spirochaetota bacterium]
MRKKSAIAILSLSAIVFCIIIIMVDYLLRPDVVNKFDPIIDGLFFFLMFIISIVIFYVELLIFIKVTKTKMFGGISSFLAVSFLFIVTVYLNDYYLPYLFGTKISILEYGFPFYLEFIEEMKKYEISIYMGLFLGSTVCFFISITLYTAYCRLSQYGIRQLKRFSS